MKYKWIALTVTGLGTMMSGLDTSAVIVGLPNLLQDLNATLVHGIWIIVGYQLMLTVLLMSLGRIADIFGRVKLYNAGFAVFTLGSFMCSLSQTGEQLILFRFVQGIGGAFVVVNSAAIVTDAFPRKELGTGLGINIMAYNLGITAGFTLGGILIGFFGWRSIFLINVPIGIFGTLWAHRQLEDTYVRISRQRFDYFGSILYGVSLSTILYALTVGNPLSTSNAIILALGTALFASFILFEKRVEYPILDLGLFSFRQFTAGNISGFLNALAFNCAPFLLSLYFQLVRSYDPLITGIFFIPMEIMVFVFGPVSGKLSDKYGSNRLCLIGLVSNSIAFFGFCMMNISTPYGLILIPLVFLGLGRGLFSSPNVSSIMGSIPPEQRGVANGIRTTLINTAKALSTPVSLALMVFVMPYDRLVQLVGNAEILNLGELPVFLRALSYTFLFMGIMCAAAIMPSLLRNSKLPKEV
ncbi:MAG TPA: MFS transporter [Patescibacteria group bacterium]|nr:MFS transporter [Patescibacteria group bacterium]